jgi:hypothetical protein
MLRRFHALSRARWVLAALVPAVAACTLSAVPRAAEPRFYDDDPLWVDPETQDASGAAPVEIDLLYDLSYNLFARPGDPGVGTRARNVNTVDEVPDSAWFTNRAGRQPLTVQDVMRGPNVTDGPLPGTWTVTSAKTDGVTPGFTVKDTAGTRWFIKFDPPGYRAMATGTEVVVTNLMWALGYQVPENHIARLVPKDLVIAPGTKLTPPGGTARLMTANDVAALLAKADREPDGSYRVIASRGLEGRPIGGIRFYGTRPDDPNDLVPHEMRRELRGYGTFAAWFNHVDAKAGNALDMVVEQDGHSVVRHHLIDFGSTLGSGAVAPREEWEGYEYMVQPKDVAKGIVALGFYILPWRTVAYYESPAIGRLPRDNTRWDPERWRPRVPNPAFIRARADDKFWAATKAAAITDEMIRAAVAAGQFGAPDAETFLARAIIERRDAILRAYLPAVNPIANVALSADGTLTFTNAAVDAHVAAPPASYHARWAAFDNATGETSQFADFTARGATLGNADLPRQPGAYIQVEIAAGEGAPAPWRQPIVVHFTRTTGGWKLIGLQRLE